MMKQFLKKSSVKWEKERPKPKPPHPHLMNQKRANAFVRLLFLTILAVFIGFGFSTYQANVKVEKATQAFNQSMKVLNDNQIQWADKGEQLSKKQTDLENKIKALTQELSKLKSTPKKEGKK